MGRPHSRMGALFDFLILHFGWLYLLCIHLPIAFVWRKIGTFQNRLSLWLQLGINRHPRKVALIQRQLRNWNKKGRTRMLCTAGEKQCQRMCFTRPCYKRNCFPIKMDNLQDIIEINPVERFVRVEPGVTVAQLFDALLPIGQTLAVVPEIGQLTIGGLILGGGIGSGSARNGLFQHSCLAFEVLTIGGEVLKAERVCAKPNFGTSLLMKDGEHQALFFGLPFSMGTLGFLVSATIQTMPCPPFLKLVYQPCLSQKVWHFGTFPLTGVWELTGRLREETNAKTGNTFVEAIQFDRNNAVLIAAKFVDQIPKNERRSVNNLDRWNKPSFYELVKTEYVPSGPYFRRHWHSLFWEVDRMFPRIFRLLPFRLLIRLLFPPTLPLLRSRRARQLFARQHILQNIIVPAKSLHNLTTLLDEQFQIYPLWLCPVTLPSQPGLLRNRQGSKALYVNVGIYGKPASEHIDDIGERMRTVEAFAREVQGFQMLGADFHQTAAEFWDMFDASLYDWLRAKYDCKGAMPSVYDKICWNNREL